MIKAQAQSAVDHLTSLENTLLDRQLVLNGVFKDEIARMLKVQADAQEKLGMIDTVAAAEKVRKDADSYAASTRASADKALASANSALAAANSKMDAALTKEQSIALRETQALEIMAAYEAKDKDFANMVSTREAALVTREAALSAGQTKLANDAAALAVRQRATLDQLEAAKKLAQGISA